MTAELLQQVALAAGGVAVGFVLGRWERTVNKAKPTRQRWREIGLTLFGLLIVTSVLVTYLQGQATVSCYRGFFAQVSTAFKERSEASGETAALQRALAQASLVNDETIRRRALVDYVAALDAAEATRRAAPIPELPSC